MFGPSGTSHYIYKVLDEHKVCPVNCVPSINALNETIPSLISYHPAMSKVVITTGVTGSNVASRIEIHDFVKIEDQFSLYIQALGM